MLRIFLSLNAENEEFDFADILRCSFKFSELLI